MTIVPPRGDASIAGRKVRQVWKWESVFMLKVRVYWDGVRESRGRPFTIPALFIRMVGVPSYCRISIQHDILQKRLLEV